MLQEATITTSRHKFDLGYNLLSLRLTLFRMKTKKYLQGGNKNTEML